MDWIEFLHSEDTLHLDNHPLCKFCYAIVLHTKVSDGGDELSWEIGGQPFEREQNLEVLRFFVKWLKIKVG